MVGVPFVVCTAPACIGGGTCRRRMRRVRRGGTRGLIDEFDLVERNEHVVFAHPQEAPDPDDHARDFAGMV